LRTPDARVVAIRIAFATGSADDPASREGLTKLTATMMAEGGTVALPYAELEAKLYPLAAAIETNVERDETVFSATVPAAALDRFYPLLRDVLLTPRFDDESFARLRARQTSDLTSQLRGANDEELGKEALEALLYADHPYGHPPVGTEHALAATTLDDVKEHYARAFCRDRVTVGVAGGYPDGFDATVLSDLGKLKACDADRAKLPDAPQLHGNRLLVVDKPGAPGTAISIGFPTPVTRADQAEFPALLFATDVLGLHRQSSGRLFNELREKRGLNYGDYAYAEFFQQEGYARAARTNVARRQQMVSIWLRPVKRANADFALRGALHFYSKLVEDGVSEADFVRQREFLTRLVGLDQQTESRRLGFAMDDRTYGLDKPYADLVRGGWKDLDPAKLKALMGKLLGTKDLAIAVVTSEGDAFAAELLKGDPAAIPAYDAPKPPEVQAEDKEIARFPVPLDAKAVKVVKVGDLFK
jgi:zinc protease